MKENKAKGIMFIILSAVGFSLMSVFVRLSGDVPVFEKAFFRNAIAAVVAFVLLARSGEKIRISREDAFPLLMRCAFGTVGLVSNFWAISTIGLADANMLNKMSPVFAILMSIVILKEKPKHVDILCIIVALVGAAFVVKPGTGMFSPSALVGLLGGFTAGVAYTFLRKLGQHGVKGPVIVACFSVFSSVVCLILMIPSFELISLKQLIMLLLAGCSATMGQLCITAAYTYAPAREISVYDYFQVLFAAVWAFLVWHELPDGYSVIGYVLIIGTAIWRWHLTMQAAHKEAQ